MGYTGDLIIIYLKPYSIDLRGTIMLGRLLAESAALSSAAGYHWDEVRSCESQLHMDSYSRCHPYVLATAGQHLALALSWLPTAPRDKEMMSASECFALKYGLSQAIYSLNSWDLLSNPESSPLY